MKRRYNKDKFDMEILMGENWISLSGIMDGIAFSGKECIIELVEEEYGSEIAKEFRKELSEMYV